MLDLDGGDIGADLELAGQIFHHKCARYPIHLITNAVLYHALVIRRTGDVSCLMQ